jgi:hypothetical protein
MKLSRKSLPLLGCPSQPNGCTEDLMASALLSRLRGKVSFDRLKPHPTKEIKCVLQITFNKMYVHVQDVPHISSWYNA